MLASKEQLLDAIKTALSNENNPKRNFTQSIEMIITLKGVDMKKGEIKLREIVALPKAPTKPKKVLVVPTFEQLEYAKKAQPNVILTKEELQKLQGQKRPVISAAVGSGTGNFPLGPNAGPKILPANAIDS